MVFYQRKARNKNKALGQEYTQVQQPACVRKVRIRPPITLDKLSRMLP